MNDAVETMWQQLRCKSSIIATVAAAAAVETDKKHNYKYNNCTPAVNKLMLAYDEILYYCQAIWNLGIAS